MDRKHVVSLVLIRALRKRGCDTRDMAIAEKAILARSPVVETRVQNAVNSLTPGERREHAWLLRGWAKRFYRYQEEDAQKT